LEKTARNFTNFSERKIPMCRIHQPKKEQRTFGKKYLEERFNTTLDQNQCQQNPNKERSPISEMEITEVLRMTLNWKAPETDQIAHFRLKQLQATHTYLETPFNKLIEVGQIPNYGQG
jgi:hypothetical protein